MPLTLVTPPASTLIDVAEARLHVRQDITEEDTRIRRAILACTRWAENETQRSYVARRYLLTLDAFPGNNVAAVPYGVDYSLPGNAVLLEHGPILAVQSIAYTAMDGSTTTLAVTEYQVDLTSRLGRITPKFGKIWPVTLPQIGAVQITYDVGMVAPVSFDATADTMTIKGIWKTLATGDAVRLSVSGDSTGALPLPLAELTDYYVQSVVSTGVYKLAATLGGAAIDLTTAGAGSLFIGTMPHNVIEWLLYRVGTAFEHREAEVAMERGNLVPLDFIDRLLDSSRIWVY